MSRLLAVGLLFFLWTSPLCGQTYYSYGIENNYTVTITRDALADSPPWGKDADNPPVSAKKAIADATKLKDSLAKDTKDYKWEFASAALTPAGNERWYWLITFEAQFQGISTGQAPFLRLAVLMDGTVIKPKVRDRSEKLEKDEKTLLDELFDGNK